MAKGNFQIQNDFPAAAGLGLVSGVSTYSLFGVVSNLQADVDKDLTKLAVNVIPLPDNAGEALEIVSDDVGDTAMMEVTALGPDAEYLEPFIVVLNGTTPVPLPGLISRINNLDSVGPDGFDGTVNIQQLGGGTVFITADPADQQSVQALYTVPAGRRWMVGNLIGTMQKSGGADTDAVINVLFKGFTQTKFRRPFGFGLQRSGDTSVEFDNKYPAVALGPVDIKLRAVSSATGANVAGWLSGLTFKGT
tara:strand:+ start:1241 stop:1987 length:747 start_codon:yes stop_codon:yes gene_type:complete